MSKDPGARTAQKYIKKRWKRTCVCVVYVTVYKKQGGSTKLVLLKG
jgi:hypothetical protein